MFTYRRWFSLLYPLPASSGSVLKLRQLLLESQSQLEAAKSEAQKQSNELALVSEHGVGQWRETWRVCVCVYV